jgi:4-hydroxybenzoate polyprenyltransferase
VRSPGAALRAADAFAFSSALVACAAAALVAASARALGAAPEPALLGLSFCGTVAVYGLDRVRDLARDAQTSPLRSAFVAAHRGTLRAAAVLCAGGALAAGVLAGARVLAIAAIVAAFGLAHRRLKRFAWAKPVYLTGAWTAVAVGLPAAAASERAPLDLARLGFALGIVSATVQANVVLSNLRDAEGIAGRLGTRRARALAAAFCAAALALAALGPSATPALLGLPIAMGAAVAAFRPSERYGAIVVDGALLVGAIAALALG